MDIGFLIAATQYFKDTNEDFYGDYPRVIIDFLVFEEIKKYRGFENIEKENFDELNFDQRIELLQKLIAEKINTTLPPELNQFIEYLDEHRDSLDSIEKINQHGSYDYDWIARLRLLTEESAKQNKDMEELVIKKIPKTPESQQNEIEKFKANPVYSPEQLTAKIIFQIGPTKPEQVAEIKDTVSDLIQDVPKIKEAKQTLKQAKNPVEANTLTAFESFAIPVAVRLSLPATAHGSLGSKGDPVNATAKAFYYLHGYTPETFRAVAKEAGLTQSQTQVFTNYLKDFHTAHPDFAALLAGQRAAINSEQVSKIFNGPAGIYENYKTQIPPVRGIKGLFFSMGQQAFGSVAERFVDRSIRRGLGKAAKAAGEGLTKKVGGTIIGTVFKNIGSAVGTPVFEFAMNAWSAFRRNAGKALSLGVLGGIIGGLVTGGPAGAIVGALFGAGGGATYKKWGGRILKIVTLLLTVFIGTIVTPLIVVMVGIPILIVIILFIINSGAYVVPTAPVINSNNTAANSPTGPTGPSFPVNCTTDATPLSFSNSSSSPIARRGWEITNNLKQGFWCDWNHSPDYDPELWDQALYNRDPSPPYPCTSKDANCIANADGGKALFWCTWLIIKSYNESGYAIAAYPGVFNMENDFKARGKFISASAATPENIPAGSAAFFAGFTHVALVYSVTQDSIRFIQSDAGTKSGGLTFNQSGVGIQNFSGIVIDGFGLP